MGSFIIGAGLRFRHRNFILGTGEPVLGTLGLYVGISFITIFEIIEVITDITLFCCCFKLQKPNYQ